MFCGGEWRGAACGFSNTLKYLCMTPCSPWTEFLLISLFGSDEGSAKKPKESPEAKTKELLREASRTTKVPEVKDGIASLLEALAAAENGPAGAGAKLGPAVVTPAYTSDPAAVEAFGLKASDLPALVLGAVDRKTAGGSYVSRVVDRVVDRVVVVVVVETLVCAQCVL